MLTCRPFQIEKRSDKLHKCSQCEEDFSCDEDLAFHEKECLHPTPLKPVQYIFCCFCMRTCKTKEILRAHVRSYHPEQAPVLTCGEEKCKRFFASPKELQQHKCKSSNLSCDLCSKNFAKQDNLRKHVVAVHQGAKELTCPECKHMCASKIHLKKHMHWRHKCEAESGTLKCDFCAKSFLRGTLLL